MTETDVQAPTHPDSRALATIITALETAPEDFDFEALTASYIDPPSLAWVALRRSMEAFDIKTVEDVEALGAYVQRAAALYHEAFLVGAGFQEDKMKEQTT